jgi:hypothetical protein
MIHFTYPFNPSFWRIRGTNNSNDFNNNIWNNYFSDTEFNWFTLTINQDENRAKVHLNNTIIQDVNILNNNYYIGDITIGRDSYSSGRNYSTGDIADFKIYDKVIDNNEIDKIISVNNINYQPYVHYKFDEGSGNTLYDHSGNNRHANIYNPVWIEDDISINLTINSINYNIIDG